MIAFLRKEKGYEVIVNIFDKATNFEVRVIMHAANIAEVYYDFYKLANKSVADNMIPDLLILPFEVTNIITNKMIEQIGYFKTTYKISFADSIVLAAAKLNNAKIVKSDHHEFDLIKKQGDIEFEWIR